MSVVLGFFPLLCRLLCLPFSLRLSDRDCRPCLPGTAGRAGACRPMRRGSVTLGDLVDRIAMMEVACSQVGAEARDQGGDVGFH